MIRVFKKNGYKTVTFSSKTENFTKTRNVPGVVVWKIKISYRHHFLHGTGLGMYVWTGCMDKGDAICPHWKWQGHKSTAKSNKTLFIDMIQYFVGVFIARFSDKFAAKFPLPD